MVAKELTACGSEALNFDLDLRAANRQQHTMAENMEDAIPVFTSLAEVYGEGLLLEEASRRYENLKQQFVQLYGREPELYARAPGSSNVRNPMVFFSRLLHIVMPFIERFYKA